MPRKSRFLKNLGEVVEPNVQLAGQMLVIGWEIAKFAAGKTKKAAKKIKKPIKTTYSPLKAEGIQELEKKLTTKSLIITIAGKRGSGKSTLGFRIMENLHTKVRRPCFVIGVPQDKLPGWIKSIKSIEEVKNRGVVLVDEGAISFGSRNSMKKENRQLGELMAVARHKDLTLLLVTQNTGMIDKNVLNLTDTVILKQGSLLQEKMERNVMKELYKKANSQLGNIPAKDRPRHSYIFDDDFEGLAEAELPSFWTEKISKNRA